ncbi:trans-aconitate 2-methyltransferase [Hoeflea sp. TYP-13]|uniref:trans-aconitate 2-methyltransferase n=1 Tax=Hoeflea sp. TYP-13 TaxID=3230023 RepID=UPI0034C5CC94
MDKTEKDLSAHWEAAYANTPAEDVSWFQSSPQCSLSLIRHTGLGRDEPIVDVGGGASTLIDHLLDDGFGDLTVVDVASTGLEQSRRRLGKKRAAGVEWVVADVTTWQPMRRYRLWHDRAVLHFLTDPADQARYVKTLKKAVEPGGWAIISGFAPGGPRRCSGLDIVQHDETSLGKLLGAEFKLLEKRDETHLTPSGKEQAFRFCLFQRERT